MTGVITLSDGGQNYIEFDIVCGVIQQVKPCLLAGWKGTKLLNTKYIIGGKLRFDLQWKDFNPTLEHLIVAIKYEELAGGEWLRENMSDEKKLYACPRGGDDRMMYEVDCNGLPFYFECVNYAAVAATEALLNFHKIPEVLLEDVDGVMLSGSIKPGSPETIADIGNFFMVIYNNYIVDYGIITHEATHAWAYDKWGQYEPPAGSAYMSIIQSAEPPVTEYGKTNPAEDLAEAVRYYVYSPEFLKAKCPLRYGIIKRMMTDPDYDG